jgi:hypothetical protein
MTKEEILSIARYIFDVAADGRGRETFSGDSFGIERFAALVAEKERKECAKLLTENAAQCTKGSMNEYILTSNARAILVRGDK